MKPRGIKMLAALALTLLVSACVTVNIYFPAAKVEKTAEEIVGDVYGTPKPSDEKKPKPAGSSALDVILAWLGPAEARAANATEVSNASIRALKKAIADRHRQLTPFYGKGKVGIANNGDLVIRDSGGLNLQEKANLNRLVRADNGDRARLYLEVAKALNIDQSQVGRVRASFARQWRDRAGGGWWVQADNGSWRKK